MSTPSSREDTEGHGGDVQVTSTREDGTRFTLRLPREP
jgi:signal transduction histidine kinase